MTTHKGKKYIPFSPLRREEESKPTLASQANRLLMETPLVKVVEVGESLACRALDWPNGTDSLPRIVRKGKQDGNSRT